MWPTKDPSTLVQHCFHSNFHVIPEGHIWSHSNAQVSRCSLYSIVLHVFGLNSNFGELSGNQRERSMERRITSWDNLEKENSRGMGKG